MLLQVPGTSVSSLLAHFASHHFLALLLNLLMGKATIISIVTQHYYKMYNCWRFYRLFSGGFQTATTRATVEMAISINDYGTVGVNSLSLAVIVKNLKYLYLRFAT